MKNQSKKNRIVFTCIAAFYVITVAVAACVFFFMDASPKAEVKGDVISANTPVKPVMVVIDPDVRPEEVVYQEPEQISEPQDEDVTASNESSAEELNNRLKRTDGLLPEHGTGYIFVGDSRFVHMNQVCRISDKENLFVVAKVGEGYSWFSSTALPQIKRIVSSGLFGRWKVIICLGINDLENLPQYEKKYNDLKNTYDISLVSVNPITSYGSLSNSKIDSFNSKIKKLDLPYIDTYRLLMLTGYQCTDGLHYDADTSKKIFDGILMGLEDENPSALTEDTTSVLDKASLAKKKSIQSEIITTNKTQPRQISTNLLLPPEADMALTENSQETGNAAQNTAPASEEAAPHELTQEEVDALYGIRRDEEEDHHDDEDEDDDDDD